MNLKAKMKEANEKIWLHYFNQELYKRKIIGETERNKMAVKIETRKPPARER